MSNCWLLPQMPQPARHLFSDLTVLTVPDFCDELLSAGEGNRKKQGDQTGVDFVHGLRA